MVEGIDTNSRRQYPFRGILKAYPALYLSALLHETQDNKPFQKIARLF